MNTRRVGELMNLRGRVALITGGAGHLGRAIGSALAECGAEIVVLDVQAAAAGATALKLAAEFGVAAHPLVCDLACEEDVREVPEKLAREHNRLDILVHCAALVGTSDLPGWGVPFDAQDADTWRLALETNLTAPFVLTQACRPLLEASGHGSVITIGSIYGLVGPDNRLYDGTPMGNPAAYAASKGGLLQLTRWLSTTLAPKIRANMITCGGILRGQAETFQERYVARTPLGRMATEQDFKGAAVYLASDLSQYVTGQNIVVDGGWTAW